MTVVTFNVDQYPHVKGDTVDLDKDQLKAVDEEAERRGVKDTYSKGEPKQEEATEDETTVDGESVEKEKEQAVANAEAHKEAEAREEDRVVGKEPEADQGVANAQAKKEREVRAKEAKGDNK